MDNTTKTTNAIDTTKFAPSNKEIKLLPNTKKVDFFKAIKSLSEKVVSIYTYETKELQIKAKASARIKSLNESIINFIELLDKYEKGEKVHSSIKKNDIPNLIKVAKEEIEKTNEKKNEAIKKLAKKLPDYNEFDKNIYRAYVQYMNLSINQAEYNRAFIEYFDSVGMEVNETFLDNFNRTFGLVGTKGKTRVKSGNTKLTEVQKEKDVLKLFYKRLAELMIGAGTIKVIQFDKETIKLFEDAKAKTDKEKVEAKKAKKKTKTK